MPGKVASRAGGVFTGRLHGKLARSVVVVTVGGLLSSGCTTQGEPPEVTTPSPSTVAPGPSASPEPPESGEVEIEFRYQPPDPPCPPPSAVTGLPSVEDYPYSLSLSRVHEHEGLPESMRDIFVICSYEPAVVAEDETVVLLDDHLVLVAEMVLFRSWADSYWPDAIPAFPVASDDLHDWVPFPDDSLRYRGVWREGCEPGTATCADDETAVRNYQWYLRRQGHVGNLQFELTAYYVTDRPPRETVPGTETRPPHAGERTVAVMRDFVRLVVATWEHAD